jgi:vomeronasal1 receptor
LQIYVLSWILHLLFHLFLPIIVNFPLSKKKLVQAEIMGMVAGQCQRGTVYYIQSWISLPRLSGPVAPQSVLHRHKQRVQHTHNHSLFHRCSHEDRATSNILILVSSFAGFCSIYAILTIWKTLVSNSKHWTVNSAMLVASYFPACSHLVLIISDTHVSQFFFACSMRSFFPIYLQC